MPFARLFGIGTGASLVATALMVTTPFSASAKVNIEQLDVPQPADLPATAEFERIEKQSKIPTSNRDFLNIITKSLAALERDPKDAGAYIDLAYANRNLDQYRKGLEYCNKAIELNGEIPVAYGERALAYASLHQPEKALADLERAIKLDPNNSAFYSNRGWIFTNQRQYARAIEECTKSIEIYAGYSPAFYCRSRAYLAIGEIEKAIADLTEAIKLFPNQEADYYKDRAFAFICLHQYSRALNDLVVAIRLKPNDQLAYIYKGIAMSKTGAQEDAVRSLSSAIELDDKNVSALKNRAVLYRIMRDFDKSLFDLNAALKIDPQDDTIFSELGQTYLAMNDSNQASEQFAKAIALNPDETDYLGLQARAQAHGAPMTSVKDRMPCFVDEPAQSSPEQKTDWKSVIARVRQAKIIENIPVGPDFTLFMQRDLSKYFSETGNGGTANFELLRDVATLGSEGQPVFFCWVKNSQGGEAVLEGAVRLEAQNKSGFKITHFIKAADIAADPKAIFVVFPTPVSIDILLRAKVRPPAAPLHVVKPEAS